MERLTGIGVSGGVAVGEAVLLIRNARLVRFTLPDAGLPAELERLEQARERARRQLASIRSRIAETAGADLAAVFDAQLLMLDDPLLFARAAALVRDRRINAEWAIQRAFDDLSTVLDDVEDPYLKERTGDIADVVGRVRMNLRHGPDGPMDFLGGMTGPSILIADDLTPSVVAQLDWGRIKAFVSDAGTRTSHTAILARSLKVPAVVGLHDAARRVVPGTVVIVDGTSGTLDIDPPAAAIEEASRRVASQARPTVADMVPGPAVTRDGVRIRLEANIELIDDLNAARQHGADGIGLYRSEFLLARARSDAVTEEVQYETYRRLLDGMAPRPVTVRTFDVDEDQLAAGGPGADYGPGWGSLEHGRSRLGLRAVRLTSRRRELLRTQLRALLRAGRHGELRIMFPFVSGIDDLRQARSVLLEAVADLEARGEPHAAVPVGVMIEVPSAAFTSDLLAREADFFTIGTNDLIQCCLAVDRTDDRVSHLYEPLHPAILRLIRQVRRAAVRQRIPVSLCGEMASDPSLLPLLVGFGLTEFSMAPSAIPAARRLVETLHAGDLRRVARHALSLASAHEIESYLAGALAEAGALGPAERVGATSREGGGE